METPELQVLCEVISSRDMSQDDIIEIEVGLLKSDWAEECDITISQQSRVLAMLIERHYPFYAQHNATQKFADLINTHLGTMLTAKNLADRYRRRSLRLRDSTQSGTPQVTPVIFGYNIVVEGRTYRLLIEQHEIVYGWRLSLMGMSRAENVSVSREEAIREAIKALSQDLTNEAL